MASLIRFQFHPDAAVQAVGYLLAHLGGTVDKVKLTKLLYLADRDHFLQCGRPITGDQQWALPYGPVPSRTLSLLSGEEPEEMVEAHIEVSQRSYSLKSDAGSDLLAPSATDVLNQVLNTYGNMHTWKIRDLTHKLPEYIECHVPDSSALIPYEVILKHHGGESRFRLNRPVIGVDMAAAMLCPFSESEPDL